MKYEDMSDFDINKLVAGKIFDRSEWACVSSWSDGDFVAKLVNHVQEKFDPCNNPSDAWPIIFDNRITVTPYDDENQGWFATYDTSFFIDHENPLLAAMICFLKMKDAE